MSDLSANPRGTDSVESRLRDALARGDAVLGTVAPVLRHLLASDDSGLFGDAILARVRGMTGDVGRQLCDAVRAAGGPAPDLSLLTATLGENPAFLSHVHALVLEWQMTELLQARLAIDPVLSPLLQGLIGLPDEGTAALAMKFLAAQARFGQAQRRMRLPLSELPGDLLHTALVAMRGLVGGDSRHDNQAAAAAAAAAIRADYDEARTRLGLIARLVTGMGTGAMDALSLHNAGVAIFLSTLAMASGQDRDLATLTISETQRTRLALALRAAGLASVAIEEQLLALDADADLPEGLDRLDPDRAAALLAMSGG